MKKIEVLGLEGIPEIEEGDDLAGIIIGCAEEEIGGLQARDIIVLTSKIVSKAAGRTRRLSDVKPGAKALAVSRRTGKDARWLQMIFDEGHKIAAIVPMKGVLKKYILGTCEDTETGEELIEHEQAICITLGPDGKIHTCDAGIDGSNMPGDFVGFLPVEPDKSASDIRSSIKEKINKEVAVVLADTEMIPFGTMDFAVGSAGIEPVSRKFGEKDLFGKPKFGGIDLTVHEITAASALVFGRTGAGIAVAVVRGCECRINEEQNISNTLVPQIDGGGITEAIKATMRATSYACGLKKRLVLRIASWFI